MPDRDGGHYFLTALLPVQTDPVARADGSITAPSHALREALASLPTATQSAACVTSDRVSPFARCTRTHFARLFVLDQPSYNGRDPSDAIVQSLRKSNLLTHQPVDCLPCPWLIVIIDFDERTDEADGGLDSYLRGLWERTEAEMRALFGYCHGFDRVTTAAAFADYVRSCQIETTMSFNDYWTGAPPLPSIGLGGLVAILLGVLALLILAEIGLLHVLHASRHWLWAGVPVAATIATFLLYRFVMRRGARAFPTAPGSDLPSVLKALYVQQRFVRFAAAHQLDQPDALHAAFGAFLAQTRPGDIAAPTRLPGTVDQ